MTDSFKKVFDSKGRRVRGLWSRGNVFYAQIKATDTDSCRKFPLHDAATVPQANEAMQALKKQRRDGVLVFGRKAVSPSFEACASAYLIELCRTGKKRPLTIARETSCLNSLKRHFQATPISGITSKDVMDYAAKRRESNVSGRAVDVDIIVLRHVFAFAIRDGLMTESPIVKWSSLSDGPARVRLVTRAEIDAMKSAAAALEHGYRFADYLELLACSGGREQETLRLRWSVNVDWQRGMLGFGQDGASKFGKSRWMPFNPSLEAALKSMRLRSGSSDFLFPSRYSNDRCVTTYRKNLMFAMNHAGVKNFGFHHLRHYFISHAVMRKVDFSTIAAWVGHGDGGVLIGRIYSHLSQEHSQAEASKFIGL